MIVYLCDLCRNEGRPAEVSNFGPHLPPGWIAERIEGVGRVQHFCPECGPIWTRMREKFATDRAGGAA